MKQNEKTFLENVLIESECTNIPCNSSASVKRFINRLMYHGCTHILMWDSLQQREDMAVVPILFVFVTVEYEILPEKEYIPIESEMASMVIALFLANSGIIFRDDLLEWWCIH